MIPNSGCSLMMGKGTDYKVPRLEFLYLKDLNLGLVSIGDGYVDFPLCNQFTVYRYLKTVTLPHSKHEN